MKKSRFAIAFMVITLVAVTSAFAYDKNFTGKLLGNLTEKEFDKACGDVDSTREVAESMGSVNKFFLIQPSKLDEEDSNLLGDIEKFAEDTYDVNEQDAFVHVVIRSSDKYSTDGWIVYSHFSPDDYVEDENDSGWEHYIYYFDVDE